MTLPRTATRALAGVCALALVLAGCGDDDDDSGDGSDDTEQTTEAGESTEAAEETTESTEAEEESTESTEAEDGGEGDPEAVATAEAINLKLEDLAEGWVEEPESDDEGGDDFDECFTTVDLEEVTVGEAESPTFSGETPDGQGGQVIAMQTIVFDSPESASAVLAEIATQEFADCTQAGITGSDVEGVQAALTPTVDEQPVGEESVGVAGAVQIPGDDGQPRPGSVDLHAIRTAHVASFTMTLDIGETPDTAFQQTLAELYTLTAQRQAAEVG